jgi:hypothetical protein
MNHDYLPNAAIEFRQWVERMIAFVLPHTTGATPSWAQISQAAMMDYMGMADDFFAIYQLALDVPTSANKQERKRVQKLLNHATRLFVNQYLRFPPVTDWDRTQMGIPNADTIATLVPVPETYPGLFNIVAKIGGVIIAHFRDSGIEIGQAIPTGYTGCLVNYAIGPEKITDPTLLKEVKLLTSSPARMDFPNTAGQWLSIAPRWQLKREGILGPQGPIEYICIE